MLFRSRTIRIPAHLLEATHRVMRQETQIAQIEGREATSEELSPVAQLSAERLREIARVMPPPASLDSPIGDEQDAALADFVPDPNPESLEDIADRAFLASDLRIALADLTDRERQVLAMRYGLEGEREQTLEDIGRSFGVTRERARQIEAGALRKLRQPAYLERLRSYVH